MPEAVEANIAGLIAVNDAVYIKDIQVVAQLTVKSDPEAIVVKIEPLAAEEPKEALAAEGVVTAPVEGEQPSSDQVPVPAVDSA